MTYDLLESVVLVRDLPEHGLKKGELGAIVELYPPDGLEVEFVRASGRTEVVVTVRSQDVRKLADDDVIAVRHVDGPG